MAARRSSMTTCARCGRCSRRRRGRFSARSIGPGRSASSISGSRAREIPVGHGQTRRGWVVVACLGYSRAGAGALIFSKQTAGSAGRDRGAVCGRWARCRRRWSGIARPGMHGRRRPADRRVRRRSAGSCGSAGTSASRRDPQAKGVVERLQGFMETQLRAGPARSPTSSTSSCSSTAGSTNAPTRGMHKTLRGRPIDRLRRGARGDGAAAARAARTPTGAGCCGSRRTRTCASTPATTRWTRALVGRRVEVRVDRARGHWRSRWTPASWPAATRAVFAQAPHDHRARARPRAARSAPRRPAEPTVEIRPLARYDALIA